MPSHRTERMAEAIREVIATAILFEINDPRVSGVTVLRAEVSGDLRNATVFVSLMGTDAEQAETLRGLKHARGFLQTRMAARLQTKSTPVLTIKLDEGVKKSVAISRLIDEAIASDRRPESEPESDVVAPDDDEEDGDFNGSPSDALQPDDGPADKS